GHRGAPPERPHAARPPGSRDLPRGPAPMGAAGRARYARGDRSCDGQASLRGAGVQPRPRFPGLACRSMGELLLARHGETEWSVNGRHRGRTDLPLTDDGRRRARALADRVAGRSFALVITSPMRRAMETCELAGLGESAQIREDLHEWDYGEYEGVTTAQIHERRPDWSLWRGGRPPRGAAPPRGAPRGARGGARRPAPAGRA